MQYKTKEDNILRLFSKEKPSKTAYNAAWFRACAHKDFQNQIWGPDFIAEAFLSFPIKLKKADGSSIGKSNGLFNMIVTSPEV